MKYSGKVTRTGDSKAIRLDAALFKHAPEFELMTRVSASVLGPGCVLISVNKELTEPPTFDPIMEGFLSFLSADIQNNFDRMEPMTADHLARAKSLTADVTYTDEDFE